MTEGREHYAPQGEFEKGDVVEIHEPLDVRLEGEIGEVLTNPKTVDHGDANTLSAHVVRIRSTGDLTVLMGPELRLSPENDRRKVGRATEVELGNGKSASGTYASEPRKIGPTIYQVVKVDETEDYVVKVTKPSSI